MNIQKRCLLLTRTKLVVADIVYQKNNIYMYIERLYLWLSCSVRPLFSQL